MKLPLLYSKNFAMSFFSRLTDISTTFHSSMRITGLSEIPNMSHVTEKGYSYKIMEWKQNKRNRDKHVFVKTNSMRDILNKRKL